MSFVFTNAARMALAGELDLSANIEVLLVVNGSSVPTEEDVTTIAGFTTLLEYTSANYARIALLNEAVTAENASNLGKFAADNITWSALLANTANSGADAIGMVIYKKVTNDTDSIPLFYVNDGGFPFNGAGADVGVNWNASGIVTAATAV